MGICDYESSRNGRKLERDDVCVGGCYRRSGTGCGGYIIRKPPNRSQLPISRRGVDTKCIGWQRLDVDQIDLRIGGRPAGTAGNQPNGIGSDGIGVVDGRCGYVGCCAVTKVPEAVGDEAAGGVVGKENHQRYHSGCRCCAERGRRGGGHRNRDDIALCVGVRPGGTACNQLNRVRSGRGVGVHDVRCYCVSCCAVTEIPEAVGDRAGGGIGEGHHQRICSGGGCCVEPGRRRDGRRNRDDIVLCVGTGSERAARGQRDGIGSDGRIGMGDGCRCGVGGGTVTETPEAVGDRAGGCIGEGHGQRNCAGDRRGRKSGRGRCFGGLHDLKPI